MPLDDLQGKAAERQIGFASDQVVRQGEQGRVFVLEAGLGTAHDYDQIRLHGLDGLDDLRYRRYVPDVDSEPDDAGMSGQQRLGDIERRLAQGELTDRG